MAKNNISIIPEFIERWELVKKSKQVHKYQDILVNDPCYLITITGAPISYISFSNVFNFYPTAIFFSQDSRYRKFQRIQECIEQKMQKICNITNEHYKIEFNKRGMDGILRYSGRRS